MSVGLDRDAPYHRDGGIAVVLVASCELARRDPSHSNKTLTVHSNILALLGAKGNVKDLDFLGSQTVDWRRFSGSAPDDHECPDRVRAVRASI